MSDAELVIAIEHEISLIKPEYRALVDELCKTMHYHGKAYKTIYDMLIDLKFRLAGSV